jgi:hypothetical protein
MRQTAGWAGPGAQRDFVEKITVACGTANAKMLPECKVRSLVTIDLLTELSRIVVLSVIHQQTAVT